MLELERLEWDWYVPTYRGERARALGSSAYDPAAVEIRPPTYRAWLELVTAPDGSSPMERQKRYFLAHVRGVRNLHVGGAPVADAAALWALVEADAVEAGLIQELLVAIESRSALSAGLKKNWRSGSGSPDSPSAPAGIAADAELSAST